MVWLSQNIWATALMAVLLVFFTLAGFIAMSPQGGRRSLLCFWGGMTGFLLALAALLWHVSPFFALVPLIPIATFSRLAWLTVPRTSRPKSQTPGGITTTPKSDQNIRPTDSSQCSRLDKSGQR